MPLPATPLTVKLYTGNFDTWRERISSAFIARGRPTQAYPAISDVGKNGDRTYYKSTLGDMQFILGSITDTVMARIPKGLESGVGQLYAYLEKLCNPFRLLDLPPELRTTIYEEVVASETVKGLVRTPWFQAPDMYHVPGPSRLPALAQASQQLRNEVLPVYYASNTFYLDTEYHGPEAAAYALEAWSRDVLGGSAKFLRAVDVTMPAARKAIDPSELDTDDEEVHSEVVSIVLEIRYLGVDDGLALWTDAKLDAKSDEAMGSLLSKVDAEASEEGLKGEAVLLMMHRLFDLVVDDRWDSNWTGLRLEEEVWDETEDEEERGS